MRSKGVPSPAQLSLPSDNLTQAWKLVGARSNSRESSFCRRMHRSCRQRLYPGSVYCTDNGDYFPIVLMKTIYIKQSSNLTCSLTRHGIGHEVRVANLYEEGFQSVMGNQEHRAYLTAHRDGNMEEDIRPHVENLRWCSALVFCYPTWWYSFPAILKVCDVLQCFGSRRRPVLNDEVAEATNLVAVALNAIALSSRSDLACIQVPRQRKQLEDGGRFRGRTFAVVIN